jgi:general secretion pathway protein G
MADAPRQELQKIERARRSGQAGMTIIELLAVLAIASSLASIALPKYHQIAESARVAQAIGDIQAMQTSLDTRDSLPDNLASTGYHMLDPWGNPYVYVKFPNGAPRVDRFGVQVNTTYDLYSVGPDGGTATSLDAASSFDDVVRANDGGFIGLASRY